MKFLFNLSLSAVVIAVLCFSISVYTEIFHLDSTKYSGKEYENDYRPIWGLVLMFPVFIFIFFATICVAGFFLSKIF